MGIIIMKSSLFFIFLMSCLIFICPMLSAEDFLIVECVSDACDLSNGTKGHTVIKMNGFYTHGQPGAPLLPYKNIDVLVPPDADHKSISLQITDIDSCALKGTFKLEPAPPYGVQNPEGKQLLSWDGAGKIVDGRDTAIYSADAFYPEQPVKYVKMSQMRKWKYVRVKFTPVQFNPITGQIKLIQKLNVHVTYERTGKNVSDTLLHDDALDDLARERFMNFNEAAEWYKPTGPGSTKGYFPYAIITTNYIRDHSTRLNAFVQHKTSIGVPAKIFTEDDFGSVTGPPPNERPEKIRQWLHDNYNAYGVEYVLLIGDPRKDFNDIPMKTVWRKEEDGTWKTIPTDLYYSDLTGDWDLNDNMKYGEYPEDCQNGGVDVEADVYVGRIPVYDNYIPWLDYILDRIVYYQTQTGDLSWRKRILLPESFSSERTDGAYLGRHMINNYLNAQGIDSNTLYQQGQCIDDSVFDSDLDLTDGMAAAAWITAPYGLVTWWGHGNNTGAYIGYDHEDEPGHDCGTLFDYANAPYLDTDKRAIVFQCSCLNANPYQRQNLSYSLLQKGAVAAMSGTEVTFYLVGWTDLTGLAINPDNAYEFTRNLVERGFPAGKAHALWKSELSTHWWNSFSYNLYGDPQVHYSQNGNVTDYYVDQVNGDNSNSGLSWNDAVKTITSAVLRCDTGAPGYPDVIHVAAGTYTENIVLHSHITLLGGYPPGGGDRNPIVNETRIDGAGSTQALLSFDDEAIWVDGFFIVTGAGADFSGGRMIRFSHCAFHNNSGSYGAAFNCSDSIVEFTHCQFKYNTSNQGGAVYFNDSDVTVTNCIFHHNHATDKGGAIYNLSSDLHIQNCTIADNSADYWGGGLYSMTGEDDTVKNSVFWGNEPNQISSWGEFIHCDIEGGEVTGMGCFDEDPLFVSGPMGDYYLSQVLAGQGQDSPCIGEGSTLASNICFNLYDQPICLNQMTTRTDQQNDVMMVNLGYHYRDNVAYYTPTPAPTATNTPTPTDTPTPTNTPTHTPTPTETPLIHHVPFEYVTIQSAIDAASDRDTVLVANGTFSGAGNKNLDFGGKSIKVIAENGPDYTIIDCEGLGRGFYFHTGESHDALVSGFTVRNGYAQGSYPDYCGGAIFCKSNSAPVIENCILTSNRATRGGALDATHGSPILRKCTITGNFADRGGGVSGGYTSMRLEGCVIHNNAADERGGGIYTFFDTNDMQVVNCRITGNSSHSGGGICSWESYGPHYQNCLITGNDALDGGGILCLDYSDPTYSNCTVAHNLAVEQGGGMACINASEPVIVDCIFWDNTAGQGEVEIYNDGGDPVVSYSDVQLTSGVYPGTGNINQNPLFVSGVDGEYYLDQSSKAMSPCVNNGSAESVYICFDYLESVVCMNSFSTRDTGMSDGGQVDMGYHYQQVAGVPGTYPSIQAAIDAAVDGDTIIVNDGTFTGTRNKNLDFKGKAITLKSVNGPDNCVIDCEGDGCGFYFHSGESRDTVVQGFTVTDGHKPSGGSGLTSIGSSPRIRDCYFTNHNAATTVYCIQSSLSVESCHFSACNGKVMYLYEAQMQISNSEFVNNSQCIVATNESDLTIAGCDFSDHNTEPIWISVFSSATVFNCRFFNNSALTSSGGMRISESNADVIACEFYGNSGPSGGAVCALSESNLRLFDCLIYDNESADKGGGIYVNSSDILISNCTLHANTAQSSGSGLYAYDADVSVTNSIIWGNASDQIDSTDGILTVNYSCVAGNHLPRYRKYQR